MANGTPRGVYFENVVVTAQMDDLPVVDLKGRYKSKVSSCGQLNWRISKIPPRMYQKPINHRVNLVLL